MREETLKLERIKKSCNITAKVSMVLANIMIVATVICIFAAIVCAIGGSKIDAQVAQELAKEDNPNLETMISGFDGTIGGLLSFTFHTDKLAADGEYSKVFVVYCVFGALLCAMVGLVFDMIRRVFKTIKKSETPFEEEVIKKLKRLFIILTVEVTFFLGLGEGVLVGLVCWSIYNIMDYGFTLQKEVDETL